jgi:indole-3-glycerol phosphate synthase
VAEAVRAVEPYGVDVSSGVEEGKAKKSYEKMKDVIRLAKMPSKLYERVERTKKDVANLHHTAIIYKGIVKPSQRSFYNAISAKRMYSAPNLIAEFKRTSPSNKGKPDFRPDADPVEIAQIYERCGVSAMSVLTDADFNGTLDDFKRVRDAVDLPLLRKDFIIKPSQIYESRFYGADAILLIAAILDIQQMKDYIKIAGDLGMDCLVESHNKYELGKAIEAGAKIFGINNRNLHDFTEDISTTLNLLEYIPANSVIVTESAIKTRQDVEKLSDPRINAMLIGTSLIQSPDIPAAIRELRGADQE